MSCPTIRRKGESVVPAEVVKQVDSEPQLAENLKSFQEEHTAGDPDGDHFRFTEMTPPQISVAVTTMGTPVGPGIVRSWLEDEGLTLHTMEKNVAGGESTDREAPFCHIARLKQRYLKAGNAEP